MMFGATMEIDVQIPFRETESSPTTAGSNVTAVESAV
jgi:hypothetical protein